MEKYYEIEIVNWGDYNAKLKKGAVWFRMDAGLIYKAKWELLGAAERLMWLSLLCLKAHEGPGNVKFTTKKGANLAKCKSGRLPAVIRRLEEIQWIRVVAAPSRARGNEQNTQNKTEHTEQKKARPPKTKPTKNPPVTSQTAVAAATPEAKAVAVVEPPLKGTPTSRMVALYCDLFKGAHGGSPVVRGKESGILAGLLKSLSEGEVERLLRAYFRMPDSWVVKKKHDLGLFSFNLQEVKVFADSGRYMTMADVRDKDREVQGRMEQRDGWEEMDPERKQRFLSNFEDGNKAIEGGK